MSRYLVTLYPVLPPCLEVTQVTTKLQFQVSRVEMLLEVSTLLGLVVTNCAMEKLLFLLHHVVNLVEKV